MSKIRLLKIFLFVCAAAFLPSHAYAQNSAHPKFMMSGAYYPGVSGQYMNNTNSMSNVPPAVRKMVAETAAMEKPVLTVEPSFDKVKYLKIDPPVSLNERIERLIHGIYVDVPPEYDHYGYEIRRYMAAVGGEDVLRSSASIEAQLQNIKNAQIVVKYWREVLNDEFEAIEAAIEEKNASSSTRSSFKYHKGIATAFLVEVQSWLVNNRMGLEYLLEIGTGAYSYKDGAFILKDPEYLKKYIAIYEARDKALGILQEYPPFRMMVY